MKKIIILITIIFGFVNCQSQTFPLMTSSNNMPQGGYSKDINNELNQYVGTWIYTNNNSTFRLVIQKTIAKHIQYGQRNFYTDELEANYEYIQNGVVICNTINNPDNKFYIQGSSIKSSNEIILQFQDPGRPKLYGKLILKRITENGLNKLQWELKYNGHTQPFGNESAPQTDFRVPMLMTLNLN